MPGAYDRGDPRVEPLGADGHLGGVERVLHDGVGVGLVHLLEDGVGGVLGERREEDEFCS